jgi:hypothetical protein
MRSVQGLAAAFWVVVGLGLAAAWAALLARRIRRSRPRRRHARAVARYASAQGWDYQPADWLDTGFGDPFDAGEDPWCTNVVRGELAGRRFVAFEYDVRVQVVMLDLPEALPFLEVRTRSLADDVGLARPGVELESLEFNHRWQVRADTEQYALAVLQPVLMSDLINGPDLSWRIYERRLVAWTVGDLDTELVVPAVQMLIEIETSIPAYVWTDYAERSVTPNPNDVLPY